MDRKAFFNRKKSEKEKKSQKPTALLFSGLQPYLGPFDFSAARHLLTRANFGANQTDINQAIEDGLETTLDKILSTVTPATLPLNPSYEDDPNCAPGETWVDRPFVAGIEGTFYRRYSLQSWTYEQLHADNISVQEKMTLFWHNHFAIHDINDARFGYEYSSTLRENSLGNFRDLVKKISLDPMMLRFLNGNVNIGTSPNENFARELLELFTLGKGDLIGPGEYSHYTENDIRELARVFTGWKDVGRYATDETLPGADFIWFLHDYEPKQFSDNFGGAQIEGTGEDEYLKAIDIIFQQEQVSIFICRKIFQWFVNFELTSEIESLVISPLAQILRDNDYEVKPVLRALFCSDYFLNDSQRGCQIKNPIDFVVGINRVFNIEFEKDLVDFSPQYSVVSGFSGLLQMKYYDPPNVAGWKAYYQEPLFYQTWINSVTLPLRTSYINAIAGDGLTIFGTPILQIDVLKLAGSMNTPHVINELIEQLVELILPKPITNVQLNYLKQTVLGDLEDFEWEINYLEYWADPSNEEHSEPIKRRLSILITAMMNMAEFHLM